MKKLRRTFDLTKEAQEFLSDLQPKQYKQVTSRVLDLANDPEPQDSEALNGPKAKQEKLRRIDVGEFRIIYRYDAVLVEIFIIGNRNDGKVYQNIEKKLF